MINYFVLVAGIMATYFSAMWSSTGLYNIFIKTLNAGIAFWSAVIIAKFWL